MSDLQRYEAMLKDFDVEYEHNRDPNGDGLLQALVIRARTRRVNGYGGFYQDATFTRNGAFVSFGVWE